MKKRNDQIHWFEQEKYCQNLSCGNGRKKYRGKILFIDFNGIKFKVEKNLKTEVVKMEINCIAKKILISTGIKFKVDVWIFEVKDLQIFCRNFKFYSHFLHILTWFVHLSLHYSSSGSNGLRETYITYKSLFKDIYEFIRFRDPYKILVKALMFEMSFLCYVIWYSVGSNQCLHL